MPENLVENATADPIQDRCEKPAHVTCFFSQSRTSSASKIQKNTAIETPIRISRNAKNAAAICQSVRKPRLVKPPPTRIAFNRDPQERNQPFGWSVGSWSGDGSMSGGGGTGLGLAGVPNLMD